MPRSTRCPSWTSSRTHARSSRRASASPRSCSPRRRSSRPSSSTPSPPRPRSRPDRPARDPAGSRRRAPAGPHHLLELDLQELHLQELHVPDDDARTTQLHALGLVHPCAASARQPLAAADGRPAHVSNPYLSQLERGLHEPSVRVLQSIGRALDISTETLLRQAGLADDDAAPDGPVDTEAAIRQDPRLGDDQKQALLAVYRSYVQANAGPAGTLRRSAPDVFAGRVADHGVGGAAHRRRCDARARRALDPVAPSRSTTSRGARSPPLARRRRRAAARRSSRAAPSGPAGSRCRRCDRPT